MRSMRWLFVSVFVSTSAAAQIVTIGPANTAMLDDTSVTKCANASEGLACVYKIDNVLHMVTTTNGLEWSKASLWAGTSEALAASRDNTLALVYTDGSQTVYRFRKPKGTWSVPVAISTPEFTAGGNGIAVLDDTVHLAVGFNGGVWYAQFPVTSPAEAKREYVRRSSVSAKYEGWTRPSITVVRAADASQPPLVRIACFTTLYQKDAVQTMSASLVVLDRPPALSFRGIPLGKKEWPQTVVKEFYNGPIKQGHFLPLSSAAAGDDYFIAVSLRTPNDKPQTLTQLYQQNIRAKSPWKIALLSQTLAHVSLAGSRENCENRFKLAIATVLDAGSGYYNPGPTSVRNGTWTGAEPSFMAPVILSNAGSVPQAIFWRTTTNDSRGLPSETREVDAVFYEASMLRSNARIAAPLVPKDLRQCTDYSTTIRWQ